MVTVRAERRAQSQGARYESHGVLRPCRRRLRDRAVGRGGRGAPDPAAAREALVAEYARDSASPYQAARQGYIDEVIDARETRAKVIRALQFLRNKHSERLPKKHGNIPF